MKKELLYVLPSLELCNGVAKFCFSFLNNISLDKFNITVIVHDNIENIYTKALIDKGIEIIRFNSFSMKNIKNISKELDIFYSKRSFDIIHCHSTNLAAFHMKYAKKYGVKSRILHSHSAKLSENYFKSIRNIYFKIVSLKYSNKYLACSNIAGKSLFGKREFTIINNAIDLSDYLYNLKIRNIMRKKYNITDDTLVLGHIGRFSKTKNHQFIIEVLNKLSADIKVKLFLIGKGELKKELEGSVDNLGLKENVIFIDEVNNCNEFYQAFDICVLPSLHEGLGLVLIEAQASGLKCLASSNVPLEVKILDSLEFVPLDVDSWCFNIKNQSIEYDRVVNSDDFGIYNIRSEVNKLENIYFE